MFKKSDYTNSVTQVITDPFFERKGVRVYVQREDLIHPFIQGNKWRKLKYNLQEFSRQGKEYLLTFGGGFSNHIRATAAAGKEYGIQTIGIIRGEELHENSNPVLRFASDCGMKLIFISREQYRRKEFEVPDVSPEKIYVLPEGGSNSLAVKGCAEIVDSITVDFDYILCACGTGATLAGIASSLKHHQKAIGISVLKGATFLEDAVAGFIPGKNNFQINYDYHFGGYAKADDELKNFCNDFFSKHGIKTEPIYTGKMFYALYDLISINFFKPGSTILGVHTGGIYPSE